MGKITKSIPTKKKYSNRTGVCGWKMVVVVVGNDDVVVQPYKHWMFVVVHHQWWFEYSFYFFQLKKKTNQKRSFIILGRNIFIPFFSFLTETWMKPKRNEMKRETRKKPRHSNEGTFSTVHTNTHTHTHTILLLQDRYFCFVSYFCDIGYKQKWKWNSRKKIRRE